MMGFLDKHNKLGGKSVFRMTGSVKMHWNTPPIKFTPLLSWNYLSNIPDYVTDELPIGAFFYIFEFDAEMIKNHNDGREYDRPI